MATPLKILGLGLAGAATMALGGCYDDGYGYGGVSVGVGTGYYGGGYGYDPYFDGIYGGYPAYGWFDDFYYPGNGYYVFDRGGRRFRMRDRDWQHWRGPRDRQAGNWRGRDGTSPPGTPRPGDGRWDGRRPDGRGQVGDGRWRGRDVRGRGEAAGGGVNAQQPSAERRQRWLERRQSFGQGRATAPEASGQRIERQRSFTPRTFTPRTFDTPGGGRFRQRGSGRGPQP